jgi:hypothetical protein
MTKSYIIVVLITILFAWNICLSFIWLKQRRFFSQFTQGISKNDLKTILKNIAASLKTTEAELAILDKNIKQIRKDDIYHFQRLGFVRFNPFSDTGGDQSFCICLLDQNNCGFVITSFHSREQTRIYAKSIINGRCEQSELSKEESEAVKHALDSKPNHSRKLTK